MDWIKTILEKHTKEDGTVDLEAANKEIDTDFPKNAVPKADFNSKVEELKSANDTLDTLKKENEGVEALQNQIKEHEATVTKLQNEITESRKTSAVKEALTKEGAKDIDYLMFKLGDLEVDENGKVKELESKIKELKESTPTQFESADHTNSDKQTNPPGYKPLDNSLDNGKQSTPEETATQDFEKALGITNN